MDTIADMLTIIRNGYAASKSEVEIRHSKLKEEIAKKLVKLGYLESVQVEKNKIKAVLLYKNGEPAIKGIRKVSKPSLRVYKPVKDIPKVLGGLGEVIISTPKGILTGREARKAKEGGEVILKVW